MSETIKINNFFFHNINTLTLFLQDKIERKGQRDYNNYNYNYNYNYYYYYNFNFQKLFFNFLNFIGFSRVNTFEDLIQHDYYYQVIVSKQF